MSTPVKKTRTRRIFYVHLRCPNEKLLEQISFKSLVALNRGSGQAEQARLFISRRFFRIWRTSSVKVAEKMYEGLLRRLAKHRSSGDWELRLQQRFE
jgi:hypothetical protein